jgi:hypothetical protein
MHMFIVGLLSASAMSSASLVEPSEPAMREAFASDLSDGVMSALSYVAETGGAAALERIHQARTDEYEIRTFRKVDCRPSFDKLGHVCDFAVEIDTIAGPIARTVTGRFFIGSDGLVFEVDA